MLLGCLFGGSDHQALGKPGSNINGYMRSLLLRAAGRDDDEPPLLRTLLKRSVGEITTAPARDGALLSSLADRAWLSHPLFSRNQADGSWHRAYAMGAVDARWMHGGCTGLCLDSRVAQTSERLKNVAVNAAHMQSGSILDDV